jgi:putative DNA primase/helicase
MTWLQLHAEEIPSDLRSLGWVLWRADFRGQGKPTKVPYCVSDPRRRASSTDPTTWSSFEDAVDAYGALQVDGIGCVLTAAAEISCIDLDRVIANGALDLRATTIVERCGSWTEISPSGTGLHVFVRGSVHSAIKGDQIEVYSDARYIAITGHRWPGTSSDLKYQQAYLDILAELDPRRRPYTGPRTPPPDDLAGAVLARLDRWGVPVTRLKPWQDGFLVELVACPWSAYHPTGPEGPR